MIYKILLKIALHNDTIKYIRKNIATEYSYKNAKNPHMA